MIRVFEGTTFITAECFCDRYTHARTGVPFIYASGNLDAASEKNPDAKALRSTARAMELRKLIDLTQRRELGQVKRGSKSKFEYLATKRAA